MVNNVMSHDMSLALSNPREPESEEKPQKSLNEKQQVSGRWHVFVFIALMHSNYFNNDS